MKKVMNKIFLSLAFALAFVFAAAVQVGAANLIEPFACKNIIEDLPRVMEKYKISSLKEIIGGAH